MAQDFSWEIPETWEWGGESPGQSQWGARREREREIQRGATFTFRRSRKLLDPAPPGYPGLTRGICDSSQCLHLINATKEWFTFTNKSKEPAWSWAACCYPEPQRLSRAWELWWWLGWRGGMRPRWSQTPLSPQLSADASLQSGPSQAPPGSSSQRREPSAFCTIYLDKCTLKRNIEFEDTVGNDNSFVRA